MSKQDYTVKADGWVAGMWRAKDSSVSLTVAEAKYENVTLKKSDDPKVDLTGSLDDQNIKSNGQADQAKTETAKRSRAKK